ncbi:MAG: hypothetical protein PHS60_16010, partial [Zavarzinia sp.]|nr:hypothetical protein [Zavarzinia sp.]
MSARFSPRLAVAAGLLVAGTALSGCAGGFGAPGTPREAGANLVGERCSATANGAGTTTIHCGSWQQPSARLIERVGTGDPSVALADAEWRRSVDSRMRCTEPKATSFAGDLDGMIADCRLLNGGFPT